MPGKKKQTGSETDGVVRQRLLAGATELFARKGYASTTVREIVQAAGVTKPVLYYYFPNKEGIYLELMRGAWERFDTLFSSARKESGGAREKVLHLSDQVFGLFLDHIEVARVGYSIYYGPPQGAPFFDLDAFHFKLHEVIKGLVEEGIQKKEFRNENVQEMAWAIIGAVHVAIEIELWHPELGMGRRGLGRVLNLIFDGISSGASQKKGDRK